MEDSANDLFVGFDVGCSSVHYVVLGGDKKIIYSPKPIIHFANPIGAIKEAWGDITQKYCESEIKNTAVTGSNAGSFPGVMESLTYEFDSVTIPKGAELVSPESQYVFHIGAKDAYFFNVKNINGKKVIQEWRTGTKCGGGSGILIEKQCRRLFEGEIPNLELDNVLTEGDEDERNRIRIKNRQKLQSRLEKMFSVAEKEAENSKEPSEFLARCGVVIQSDLIHKQNEGAKREDNLAGLFKTVARNYKIDVLGARALNSENSNTAIATGGVFGNDLIRKNLENSLGISITRPEHYHNIAAIGVALKGIEENNRFVFNPEELNKVAEHSKEKRQFAPPLSGETKKINNKHEELDEKIEKGTEVILGIDGGSTTTKAALVDLTGKLLDKIYIKTYGNPEGSLKHVIKYLSRHKDNVIVKGVGATGSARKLYEKILISKKKSEALLSKGVEIIDRITDEITCHALGVKHYDSKIDTIYEIGGQDMKFTRFSNGVVKEAKMNYSCQAGSGQTLENMADIIGLNVENSLQEFALKAKRIPVIDATCGVFMEMDENRLIAEGFSREEIAAAIIRGTAASYYYKFVGGAQHVGGKCSAQGGPPLGKAFLAALAQVTNKEIEAYPHREMFGAWGQALDIIENIKQLEQQHKKYGSAFRGWNLVEMSFEKERISCRTLFKEKSCGIRDCQLEVFSIEDDRIITGGFCPRGDSEGAGKPKTNYVEKYHKIYENHFKKQGSLLEDDFSAEINRITVGIKRSTATLGEKGIWSAALLKKLGFCPVVSPKSTREIAKTGIDNSRTDFCIARKLVTGHAALLSQNPNIRYLFNPSFIEHRQDKPPDLKYCIYTESEGYLLNDVLSLDENTQINPILHFGDENLLVHSLKEEFKRLGFLFSNKEMRESIRYADKAEEEFKKELYAVGDTFLKKIEENGEKAYVGIGRDYVLLDPEASSNSGVMFSQVRGLHYIPQIFLEHRFEHIPIEDIAENEFWVQSVKILKANLFVAGHPNLFPIRMMNFACGPDSLKIYQEEKIQEAANKPLLTLLTDAQTNNAPFVTRTEAHERVVNQTKPEKLRMENIRPRKYSTDNNDRRIWLIPYMGDAVHVAASALRHFGIDSEVLPTNTQRGYEIARKHIHTEVCHPLKGVVGDTLGFLNEQIEKKGRKYVEDNYLVMLPTTSGPCRFGKYVEVLRIFMDREGLQKIPIAGPSSETDYFDIPVPEKVGASNKLKVQQVLFKGINASDLLEDITLRFRPYAEDKQQITDLKKERLLLLGEVIENGADTAALIEWGKETVLRFTKANLRNHDRFPLVLYIGEIYMRQHDPYTNFVIQKLEEKQLEMVRDPITDWLLYVNQMNRRNSRRDIRLAIKNWDWARARNKTGKLINSFLKGQYMSRMADKIAQPFHEILHGRHCLPKPIDIIDTLEKNHEFHGNIEGESPLSIGIAYYFMHDLIKPKGDAYISGIFHVGPFTCMQEGVATAKIEAMAKELRKRKSDLVFPIIHAFFGDSPNPNLEAEIAVFTEQCYQKKDILKGKYGRGLSTDGENRSTLMRSPSQIVDINNKKRTPHAYEKVD
ncbi:MAG TPA: acyl-CoA dehydratase activase-related protein [Sedimentisphaerales bacterium]|nr:acyl-CoA dehydratase activase-related protein [Sedimentisphaerales bacterium]